MAFSNFDVLIKKTCRSCNWCSHDKTSFEDSYQPMYNFPIWITSVVNEPTYLLQNCSSRIDLILTSHRNIVVESGVHPSLHPHCHHQIIFAKFNLKIYYPPPRSLAL